MIASIESIGAVNSRNSISDERLRHAETPPPAISAPIDLKSSARGNSVNVHTVLTGADQSIGKIERRLKATLHLLQTQGASIENLSIVQLEMSKYVVTVGVISGVAEGCKKAISSLTQQQ